MSIEPITRLQRFLRVLADSSADMPEPLRNLEKCCCYACGHLDTRPELHTTLEKLIASVRDKSIVPPKPNTRLEKYVAAMAGVWDDELPEPITREDKILFEAASGEDVTLSGNPLILENCIGGKALKALHVYGKSTQDGTPSPDNPVPIVSAGDGGNVTVKVTGANVLEGTKPGVKSTVYGITYTTYENGVLITGTATKTFNISLHEDTIHRLTRGIYYLTTRGLSPSITLNFYYIGKFSSDSQNQKVMLTRDANFTLQLQILEGVSLNATIQVSLTRDKSTAYSPYREQLLTLPTPNGLPGIPVTSGGNYTDENGQQWICDEVDLERGVRVQRVYKVDVDGENIKFEQIGGYANLMPKGLPIALYANGQRIYAASTFTSLPWFYNTKNGQFLYLIAADISDQLNESCKKQLGKVYYALATPIETPLTPAELTAYKALTTYAPTTVLQATDGAGLEVTYKCNVRKAEKTINDLYAELTAELEA